MGRGTKEEEVQDTAYVTYHPGVGRDTADRETSFGIDNQYLTERERERKKPFKLTQDEREREKGIEVRSECERGEKNKISQKIR